jgi:hypothetical protein
MNFEVKWIGVSGVEKVLEFPSLALAMEFSKGLGAFVVISNGEFEIVGKFGVDSIKEGVLPDGVDYTWMKRRTQ